LGDIVKTAWPVLLAIKLNYSTEETVWVGSCALLGHCYPIFFRFKGGKGVASLLTLVAITKPAIGFLGIITWLISAVGFLRSSAASLLAALIMPIFAAEFFPELLFPLATLSAIIFIQHRSNIANMMRGKEPIISKRWKKIP
jgi:glycerol-3-phosphate acyltransferase PlsY